MSPAKRPARQPSKPSRRGRRKGRGRGVAVALSLLGILAAGMAALAIYFGFVPGPESWLGHASTTGPDTMSVPAIGTPSVDTVTSVRVEDTLAPSSPAPAAEPATVTTADSAAGDAVYRGAGRCIGCHGPNGEGVVGLGPSLVAPRLGDGSLASTVRIVGGGAPLSGPYRIAMPAYGAQLAAADIAHVAAYVYALGHPGQTVADSAAPAAEAAGGAVNADAPPVTAPTPAPRPVRPTVPPPPATGAARRP